MTTWTPEEIKGRLIASRGREEMPHEDFHGILRALTNLGEFVDAVKANRLATEAFAEDGMPHNYAVFDDSERRLMKAMHTIGGES